MISKNVQYPKIKRQLASERGLDRELKIWDHPLLVMVYKYELHMASRNPRTAVSMVGFMVTKFLYIEQKLDTRTFCNDYNTRRSKMVSSRSKTVKRVPNSKNFDGCAKGIPSSGTTGLCTCTSGGRRHFIST